MTTTTTLALIVLTAANGCIDSAEAVFLGNFPPEVCQARAAALDDTAELAAFCVDTTTEG
jgi:hypothetical protein